MTSMYLMEALDFRPIVMVKVVWYYITESISLLILYITGYFDYRSFAFKNMCQNLFNSIFASISNATISIKNFATSINRSPVSITTNIGLATALMNDVPSTLFTLLEETKIIQMGAKPTQKYYAIPFDSSKNKASKFYLCKFFQSISYVKNFVMNKISLSSYIPFAFISNVFWLGFDSVFPFLEETVCNVSVAPPTLYQNFVDTASKISRLKHSGTLFNINASMKCISVPTKQRDTMSFFILCYTTWAITVILVLIDYKKTKLRKEKIAEHERAERERYALNINIPSPNLHISPDFLVSDVEDLYI